MQHPFDSALLATDALVPRRRKTGNSRSSSTRARRSCTVTSIGQQETSVPPEPVIAQPARLDIVEQSVKSLGFSEAVSKRISSASTRESTQKVYNTRWTEFANWCTGQGLDPMTCTIPKVADFLLFLFSERKLAVGTIANYRSAIASTWAASGNQSLSTDVTIANLIRSFHSERPRPVNSVPAWSLSLVLDALRRPPFEPLSKIPLANLSHKTVFLVALASGRRRSELHAITDVGSGLVGRGQNYNLQLDVRFLAKTERQNRKDVKSINIPALPELEREERSLCPVRALQHYRTRTEAQRKASESKKFFVSYKQGFKGEITTQTISRWITSTVRDAYQATGHNEELLQLHSFRAHEVRALSASVAFDRAVPLHDVLQAAQWRCHNTFTSFYLRDMTMERQGLMALGPIVAAQRIVQP